MLPKVSVIIPTLNSWVTLKSCIASLYKQTVIPYEIIVVDNGSSDDTSKKVKNQFPKVKLVSLNKNTGVVGGRNAGIDNANKDSQYLLFFDHDMVADRNMLASLIDVAEMDKSFGIVTPKIYYWEDKQRIWSAGTNINLWTGQVLFRGGKDIGQFEMIEEVQVAPAAILVKKEVINKIYEFDNRYFVTYEDTDFCFRAKKQSFKTIYSPNAVAFHNISTQPSDEQKRLLDRSFWIGRNKVIFMRNYGKSYFLFVLFSPIYMLYFFKMALEQRNLKGLINYFKGFIEGILQSKKS